MIAKWEVEINIISMHFINNGKNLTALTHIA